MNLLRRNKVNLSRRFHNITLSFSRWRSHSRSLATGRKTEQRQRDLDFLIIVLVIGMSARNTCSTVTKRETPSLLRSPLQKNVWTRGFSVAMLPSMLTISNSGVYLGSIARGQQQTKNIIYHNVRFLYYITIATKSKRNQNFVHAKRHTTVKYQISFNQLAVTVHKKVTLTDKKRNHTNKFVSPLTESLIRQRSHLMPSQVHELRYALGANVNTVS